MPHNTNYKFKPEMCQSLVDWMSKGLSYTTWSAAQDPRVATSTLYEWEKQIPEWKEAKLAGYKKGLEFFEKLAISNATGVLPESLKKKGSTGINTSMVIFVLKTRFHREYGEISKIEHSGDGQPINVNFVKNKPPEK